MTKKIASPLAGKPGLLRRMFSEPAFVATMAAPLVGLGASALGNHLSQVRGAKQKTTAMNEMLELHPHLKQRDRKEVARIFNSLHNVNPMMARDPMVSGAWVDNILESKTPGQNAHHAVLHAVKDLAGIRSQISGAMRNEGGSSAGSAAQAFTRDIGKEMSHVMRGGVASAMHDMEERAKDLNKSLDERVENDNKMRQRLLSQAMDVDKRRAEVEEQAAHVQALASQVHSYADAMGLKTSSEEELPPANADLSDLFSALGVV